jgi:hypothetical protein
LQAFACRTPDEYLLVDMQQNGLRPFGGIYKALDGQNSNLRWDIPTTQLQASVLHVDSRQIPSTI